MRWTTRLTSRLTRLRDSAGPRTTARSAGAADSLAAALSDGLADVLPEGVRPVLVVALDGFLGAGSAPRLVAEHLRGDDDLVLAELDLDDYYDYRARRPPIAFRRDHYADYSAPRLDVRLLADAADTPFLLLSGPEPDYRWEAFVDEVTDLVELLDVSLVIPLGAVPMGVPHTRPLVLTSHANRQELVHGRNLWDGELMVPSSAMSLLELRLGERGHDSAGYVVHVPHYLAQVDFPAAAVALLEAVGHRSGLVLDLERLRVEQSETLAEIEKQIHDQDGESVLAGLEQQYDAFTRGADGSLLADKDDDGVDPGPLPDADELGRQFEQFLAHLDRPDDRDRP